MSKNHDNANATSTLSPVWIIVAAAVVGFGTALLHGDLKL